jgi:two-component system, NtrC family, nitrogen regulation response regulator NtrX
MSKSDDHIRRLAFLAQDIEELNFFEALRTQIPASFTSGVYPTSQLREYREFACDYCVLYAVFAAPEVIKSLVAIASDCPSRPKLILLLPKQNTAKLKNAFDELGTQPQIILLENPDKLRAADLINSYLILERQFEPPHEGWAFRGASAPVHELYHSIERFAPWDKDPVLIFGETGTGKELIARRLHEIRGKGNFHPYNFAAIPLQLAESLLFGHAKGAYTDAKTDEVGYIEQAGNGTLLIDEIGEVHPTLQVKLLRTLQERTMFKVGESRERKVQARFVFATNKDLEAECRKPKRPFREDLFHRISALQINVPPLRDRKVDIPLLVQRFVEEFNEDYRHVPAEISLDNIFKLSALFDYNWPGNVRELRNVVRQAAAMAGKGSIDKKLAELIEKKIEGAGGSGVSSSLPRGDQGSRELGTFISSLLNDTRPNAQKHFEKAYDQALLLKTKGDLDEMQKQGDIKDTTANKIKGELLLKWKFKTEDLKDAAGLATRLKQPTDPVSSYISSQFYPTTRQMLMKYRGGELDKTLLAAMVKELNRQLQNPDLYQAERFSGVQLSEGAQTLINPHGVSTGLFKLNRILIEDAYPDEIMSSPLAPCNSNPDR